MSKCHDVTGYKELAAHLLSDVHGFLPTSNHEVARDVERVISLVENRGLGFLTLTLPAAGKHFDACLAARRLTPLQLPGFKPIGGKVSSIIPSFLRGIWTRVFDMDGLLCEDPCIASIASLRQFFYCFKKARFDCDPSRIQSTIRDFYRVDASLRPPSHHWDGGCVDDRAGHDLHLGDKSDQHDGNVKDLFGYNSPGLDDPSILDTVQSSLDCVASTLGDFVAEEWRPKHGPGAVSDGRLGKFFKYNFPNWSARLESEFPVSSFGFPNYESWVSFLTGESDYPETSFNEVDGPSRLITVPKTMKGPRLIASEPTSNQFCQQIILDYLTDRVKNTFLGRSLSFNDQTPNQVRALAASHTGEDATIDLSSASDCVSCWLIERAFRRNRPLLRALYSSRTAWLLDEISSPPRFHYMRKFTTMGAATTFPVQSIIYVGIAVGVILHMKGTPVSARALSEVMSLVRVFGDDIIVPKDVSKLLIRVLTYLGFEVNQSKTFTEGNFRESCGVDAYDGVDVTPGYILGTYDEQRPSSIESVRESANNLFEKGLWKTAKALERTLPSGILSKMPVVGVGSGLPGRSSYCGRDVSHLKSRWNADLQRTEYQTIGLRSPAARVSPGGSASLLQYFLEAPDPSSGVSWSSGYDERPGVLVHTRWVDPNLVA